MEKIPADPGSYLLLARLMKAASIRVGALGVYNFEPGVYCYSGSALGPGGLKARINHHLRPSARPTWHFDYLKTEFIFEAVWFSIGDEPLECSFSRSLQKLPQAKHAVRFFGSRDCREGCYSHMVSFPFDVNTKAIYESIHCDFYGIKAMPVFQIC